MRKTIDMGPFKYYVRSFYAIIEGKKLLSIHNLY